MYDLYPCSSCTQLVTKEGHMCLALIKRGNEAIEIIRNNQSLVGEKRQQALYNAHLQNVWSGPNLLHHGEAK